MHKPPLRAYRMRPCRLGALGLAAICCGTPVLAAPPVQTDDGGSDDGGWHFRAIPYLWLPGVKTRARVTLDGLSAADGGDLGTVNLDAQVNPDDYLGNLSMAFMGMGEARKGPWSLYTDIIYTSFDSEATRARNITGPLGRLTTEISGDAETDLGTTVWTLGGGYRVVARPAFSLDLMAGFRYLTMDSDLTLELAGADGRFSRSRKVSLDQDVWDGILGIRGEILFTDTRWFAPYYLDAGTGDSNWTWQALVGLGYRFDWGDVTLAFRALAYDFDDKDADLTLAGPGLGVGFHW